MEQTQENISQPCKLFKGYPGVKEAPHLQHKMSKASRHEKQQTRECEMTIEGVRGRRETSVGRSGSNRAEVPLPVNCVSSGDRKWSITNLQGW